MKMIKAIEFTDEEKQAIKIFTQMWETFSKNCNCDDDPDGCPFYSLCQNSEYIFHNSPVEAIAEAMKDRM